MAAIAGSTQLAQAQIPYPNSGTYNNNTYTFTAASTGDLVAYFAGSGAGYDNQLGLLVNGVAQGGFGLDDHTSAIGDSYNFGSVNAGDTLTFILHNLSVGADAYSDPSMNVAYDGNWAGGHNHLYSTDYTGNPSYAGVPNGTYVAFEDIPFDSNSDYNYYDESFVFVNVNATTHPAPDARSTAGLLAATLPLLALGRRFLRR